MKLFEDILPETEISKKDSRRLGQRLRHAHKTGEPVNLYVGTCPDYSHDGTQYTFESIGNGVPLLTQKQLRSSTGLFESLSRLWHTV
jgi:hypothetical protein